MNKAGLSSSPTGPKLRSGSVSNLDQTFNSSADSRTAMEAATKLKVAEAISQASVGPILAGVNRVFGLLRQVGLLRTQRIEPRLIGVNPMNRDGYGNGLSGRDCYDLIDSIFEIGFDSTQINAVALEVDPNNDLEVVAFNRKVPKDSQGLLPEIPAHNLLFASLSASHTNAAPHCIAAQVRHDREDMCINGLLSAQVIGQKDAAYEAAVMQGVEWKVISRVGQEFLGFLHLMQSGLNSSGQVARVSTNFRF